MPAHILLAALHTAGFLEFNVCGVLDHLGQPTLRGQALYFRHVGVAGSQRVAVLEGHALARRLDPLAGGGVGAPDAHVTVVGAGEQV